MRLELDEVSDECFAKAGTQAHIAKLREVVAFVFLHGTSGMQQQL